MKKTLFFFLILFTVINNRCKVTFITGYDTIIDETATKLKKDFNLFYIRFSRSIHDNDPNDQIFSNFQDYYDNMEVDLKTLHDRALFLPEKSGIVVKEINNISTLMIDFENTHKKGIHDIDASHTDDKHPEADGINSAINALIKLEEELKTTGKTES